MENEFIGQAETAALLGVSNAMVLYMVKEQKILRRYRRNGKIVYKFSDVVALLESRAGRTKPGRPSGQQLLAQFLAKRQAQVAAHDEVTAYAEVG